MKSFKQFMIEAKLEWGMGPGNVYDAGKLFGTGGRFDPESPSAPQELSANAIAAKPGIRPMGAFFNTDGRGIPTDGLFSISHEAKLINAKTGQKQPNPDSLLVSSNRTEEGDLEFNIRKTTYEDVQDIHRYILPAGAKYDWNLYEFPSSDGHKLKPGASHHLSISDANRVIQEHMLSRIKTGPSKGIPVSQAHDVV